MKRRLVFGPGVARLSCLAFVLLGFSHTVTAQPIVTNSNYSLAVFAKAPKGLTNPDSITTDGKGTIFVAYANGTQPDGTGGSSTIVGFSSTGSVLKKYHVVGKCDGMKYDPADRKLWCELNEDANPAVTLVDPATGHKTHYSFAAPPAAGGGYDDVVFLKGQIFISASNPNVQPPTPQTPNGQNVFPSIVKATIVGHRISVTPVLMGNATLIDISDNATQRLAQQSDPDSLTLDQSGHLVLDSQADGELIFLTAPGTPNQVGTVLHLLTSSSTQVTVDDTVFPTQPSGTIYVVDTSANVVYAVSSHAFPPNSAFSASDNTGVLAQVDLTTGQLTSIVSGMKSPHGALFVPSLPLGQ
ncbi:MAG: hypothetical protein JO271_00090 [Verrucomicrobia bacterium]|nr:hypothetical protein [Verrucomicrobiota bacterium]